ncbi:MAG: hypothetical protein Q8J74_14690, partial [Candidatus Didemnitutus sp.]|nr:hypothetical protein [Candidatus Didemnitutus sp.]
MKTSARFMRTLVFVAGLAGATMLGAASPASETKAADKLLDRWVEAMGGARQLQAQKTAEYQLRMIAGNGFSWTSTAQVFPGGYFRVVSELPNGQLVQAYDGKLAWQQHAALGAGLPDQVSVEQTRRESDLHAPL